MEIHILYLFGKDQNYVKVKKRLNIYKKTMNLSCAYKNGTQNSNNIMVKFKTQAPISTYKLSFSLYTLNL